MTAPVFIADLYFHTIRDIRSVPPFHGARWSAVIRLACRAAGLLPDAVFSGLLPMRIGTHPLLAGFRYTLRLFLTEDGATQLPLLCRSLSVMPAAGLFSAESLHLDCVTDPVCNELIWSEGFPTSHLPVPLGMNAVLADAEKLQSLTDWSLLLVTPLRLQMPAIWRSGSGDRNRYCDPGFFTKGTALAHILAHIRHSAPPPDPFPGTIISSSLAWIDMRYGAERHVALGGVTGIISCTGALDREWALRLAWGRLVGCGKNARFGLGYWSIPELFCSGRAELERFIRSYDLSCAMHVASGQPSSADITD